MPVVDRKPDSSAGLYRQRGSENAAIVTYCSNPTCANSSQVATKLEQLGYTNIRKYANGIQDWTEAGLPTHSGAPTAR